MSNTRLVFFVRLERSGPYTGVVVGKPRAPEKPRKARIFDLRHERLSVDYYR